ncbi:MAG TPA: tRNA dihydrouridine(16) synthase DusC, partial [Nevskiaceae bacterium]|nr:tRNA dihydrouridine(16) synthase DusC [Nevskiaceae bacterium]
GRGLVARPDLALAIRAAHDGREHVEMEWTALSSLLRGFWEQQRRKLEPAYAPGRLKQWLIWLGRSSREAAALFAHVRREVDCAVLDRIVEAA